MGFDAICIQLVKPVLLGDRQLGISAHCDLRSVAMVEHQVQLLAEVKGTNIMQSPESANTIYMVHEGCRNSLEALATGFTDAPPIAEVRSNLLLHLPAGKAKVYLGHPNLYW